MSLKDFQVISKLGKYITSGEGAYSSVYKVRRLADSMEYALKKVKLSDLSEKEKQNALNEVRILASIRSPHVILYKEYHYGVYEQWGFVPENTGMVEERLLYERRGHLVDFNQSTVFIQLVKGLKGLHDINVFHRDVKNVSKLARKGLLYTQTGTPYYASPEVWKDQPYNKKSDIWSLGCVLYEMTMLKPPFRAEDMEGLYKKVTRGVYPKISSHFSNELGSFIKQLLQVQSDKRPSCEQILNSQLILKKMNQTDFIKVEEINPDMLQTIRIPKNLNFLTDKLPRPNYNPVKIVQMDRKEFFNTVGGQVEIMQSYDYSKKLPNIRTLLKLDKKNLNNSEIYDNNRSIQSKQQSGNSSLIKSKNALDNSKQKIKNQNIYDIKKIYGAAPKKKKQILLGNEYQARHEKQKTNFSVLPKIKQNPPYKLQIMKDNQDTLDLSIDLKNKKAVKLQPIDNKISALAMKKNIYNKRQPKRSLNQQINYLLDHKD